jgi:glycosyltransferase involved in cell wall biosynthesis
MFLEETLDSLLAQTFQDFELIISDNASTDGTEEICRRYASLDRRIHHFRNETNLGAAANFNEAFRRSSAELFKWAACDDLLAPNHLEQCVAALDENPAIVLAYTRAKAIDAQGDVLWEYPASHSASSPKPHVRFCEFANIGHPFVPIFGVVRSEVLAKTPLIGLYQGGDRPLVSELSLRGPFHEVPECLFFYRNHAEQSWRSWSTRQDVIAWYDPSAVARPTSLQWPLLAGHLKAIHAVPLTPRQRLRSLWCMIRWVRVRRKVLLEALLGHYENRWRELV